MQWAKKIVDVQTSYMLGESPAAVDRVTGILYINPFIYPMMSEEEKKFVIEHECAHIDGQLIDEEATDELASARHFRKGNSLMATVFSLAKILPAGHPRIEKQLLRAEYYDKFKK